MTLVYDCSLTEENQVLRPQAEKTISGVWTDPEVNEEVLLACEISPHLSVLVEKHRQRLRIQLFDTVDQLKQTDSRQRLALSTNHSKDVALDEYIDDCESQNDGSEIHFDLRLQKIRGTFFCGKVITMDSGEQKRAARIQRGLDSEENLVVSV